MEQLHTSYTSSWWKWGTSKSLKQRQACSEGEDRGDTSTHHTHPLHCEGPPPPLAHTSWTSAEDRYSSSNRPICGGTQRHSHTLLATAGQDQYLSDEGLHRPLAPANAPDTVQSGHPVLHAHQEVGSLEHRPAEGTDKRKRQG